MRGDRGERREKRGGWRLERVEKREERGEKRGETYVLQIIKHFLLNVLQLFLLSFYLAMNQFRLFKKIEYK